MSLPFRREDPEAKDGSAMGALQEVIGGAVDRLYRALSTNRVTRLPWAVIQTFSEAQGALLSGSIAYYTFLSLLPLLLVAGFFIGTLSAGNVELREALAGGLDRLFPGIGARDLLDQLISSRATFGLVGLVAMFYAGSGFVGSLTACMNHMWKVPAGRNPVGQKLVNIGIIVLLGVALLGSSALSVWVAYVTRSALEGSDSALRIVEFTVGPISMLLVLLLLYRVLPATRLTWRSQIAGALFGAVGIEVLKRAFGLWADMSAGVSALPRSLLSVVLLLIWLGFFGQLVLYGAALNVVRARKRKGESPFPPGWITS